MQRAGCCWHPRVLAVAARLAHDVFLHSPGKASRKRVPSYRLKDYVAEDNLMGATRLMGQHITPGQSFIDAVTFHQSNDLHRLGYVDQQHAIDTASMVLDIFRQ